jgi:hypothetical protein
MSNQKKTRRLILPPLGEIAHDASRGTCSICRKRPGTFLQTIQDFGCWTCQIEHISPAVRECIRAS